MRVARRCAFRGREDQCPFFNPRLERGAMYVQLRSRRCDMKSRQTCKMDLSLEDWNAIRALTPEDLARVPPEGASAEPDPELTRAAKEASDAK